MIEKERKLLIKNEIQCIPSLLWAFPSHPSLLIWEERVSEASHHSFQKQRE